jgi:hypothetical protein
MPIDTTPRPAPPKAPPRKPGTSVGKHVIKAPADITSARAEALNGLGQITALVLVMRGAYADAGAIAQHGPGISQETAKLADQNESIANLIDYLTQAGPYMGLVSVVLPFVLQLAVNHNRIDAAKLSPDLGVLPPDVLEKRVRAEMEAKRAEVTRQYEEATVMGSAEHVNANGQVQP